MENDLEVIDKDGFGTTPSESGKANVNKSRREKGGNPGAPQEPPTEWEEKPLPKAASTMESRTEGPQVQYSLMSWDVSQSRDLPWFLLFWGLSGLVTASHLETGKAVWISCGWRWSAGLMC